MTRPPFFPWCEPLGEPQTYGVKGQENYLQGKTFCSKENQSGQHCPFPGVQRCKWYKFKIFNMAVFLTAKACLRYECFQETSCLGDKGKL